MTIDEAIKHAEEVAEEKENFIKRTYKTFAEDRLLFAEEESECKECADEHRQLAEWLKDYKRLLKQESSLDKIKAEIEALPKTYPFVNHIDMYVKVSDVTKIIGKYKAESEE